MAVPPGARLPILAGFSASFSALTLKIFLFFFKTGLLVFGSGLVIVPFLKTYIVDQYHWLDNRQFLDSVAVGMISPGGCRDRARGPRHRTSALTRRSATRQARNVAFLV